MLCPVEHDDHHRLLPSCRPKLGNKQWGYTPAREDHHCVAHMSYVLGFSRDGPNAKSVLPHRPSVIHDPTDEHGTTMTETIRQACTTHTSLSSIDAKAMDRSIGHAKAVPLAWNEEALFQMELMFLCAVP